ncbi:hemagglutinin repeat-containing protein, partial [Burkholderia multivorans]|nr:hemagglutinin repeat-containing protein [Burkholderia multivorans]
MTAGNTLTIESGGDTNLKGAVASGRQVIADVGGNLNIESLLSRGGVKEPGMGGVMAPAEPGVKRGFERFQGCGFLPFLATAF